MADGAGNSGGSDDDDGASVVTGEAMAARLKQAGNDAYAKRDFDIAIQW